MERFREWMSAEVLKKLLSAVDEAHQVLDSTLLSMVLMKMKCLAAALCHGFATALWSRAPIANEHCAMLLLLHPLIYSYIISFIIQSIQSERVLDRLSRPS